jgi:phenylalanyl-tRNA synthetase beta chain
VSPALRERFDLKNDVYFLEMNFQVLVNSTRNLDIKVKELPKYPEVKRDLALLLDRDVTFSQLRELALRTERKLLKNVSLFDVYEGDKLPEGKKSYALSFILEDIGATLTDAVIDKTMKNLAARFERELGATIRQ